MTTPTDFSFYEILKNRLLLILAIILAMAEIANYAVVPAIKATITTDIKTHETEALKAEEVFAKERQQADADLQTQLGAINLRKAPYADRLNKAKADYTAAEARHTRAEAAVADATQRAKEMEEFFTAITECSIALEQRDHQRLGLFESMRRDMIPGYNNRRTWEGCIQQIP